MSKYRSRIQEIKDSKGDKIRNLMKLTGYINNTGIYRIEILEKNFQSHKLVNLYCICFNLYRLKHKLIRVMLHS